MNNYPLDAPPTHMETTSTTRESVCHLDDDEFTAVIYEFTNRPVHFDPERLSSLSINPLTSDFERFLVQSDDLDPDIHFNFDSRYSYFVEDKFNNVLHNETAISREQLNHLSFSI